MSAAAELPNTTPPLRAAERAPRREHADQQAEVQAEQARLNAAILERANTIGVGDTVFRIGKGGAREAWDIVGIGDRGRLQVREHETDEKRPLLEEVDDMALGKELVTQEYAGAFAEQWDKAVEGLSADAGTLESGKAGALDEAAAAYVDGILRGEAQDPGALMRQAVERMRLREVAPVEEAPKAYADLLAERIEAFHAGMPVSRIERTGKRSSWKIDALDAFDQVHLVEQRVTGNREPRMMTVDEGDLAREQIVIAHAAEVADRWDDAVAGLVRKGSPAEGRLAAMRQQIIDGAANEYVRSLEKGVPGDMATMLRERADAVVFADEKERARAEDRRQAADAKRRLALGLAPRERAAEPARAPKPERRAAVTASTDEFQTEEAPRHQPWVGDATTLERTEIPETRVAAPVGDAEEQEILEMPEAPETPKAPAPIERPKREKTLEDLRADLKVIEDDIVQAEARGARKDVFEELAAEREQVLDAIRAAPTPEAAPVQETEPDALDTWFAADATQEEEARIRAQSRENILARPSPEFLLVAEQFTNDHEGFADEIETLRAAGLLQDDRGNDVTLERLQHAKDSRPFDYVFNRDNYRNSRRYYVSLIQKARKAWAKQHPMG